jgi:hypothetical protein
LRKEINSKEQENTSKTIIDNQEFEQISRDMYDIQNSLEKSEKNYTTALDKLKQCEEELEDKNRTVKKLKGEIIELSSEKSGFESSKDKLKNAYNMLMNKYVNLKKSSKEEIERLLAREGKNKSDQEAGEDNWSQGSSKKPNMSKGKEEAIVSLVQGEEIESTDEYFGSTTKTKLE